MGKRNIFGRKKKQKEFDESEELFYSIPSKSLNEFRKGFDETGEIVLEDAKYAELFDENAVDEEVQKNFERIQNERRRRVARAVESAGVDIEKVEDELGVIAPVPVTSMAADPYTKQLKQDFESGETEEKNFQNAIVNSSSDEEMEIKLNVLNSTVELQKTVSIPKLDEDTLQEIKSSIEDETQTTQTVEAEKIEEVKSEKKEVKPFQIKTVSETSNFRDKTIPLHIINIDILQSAIQNESAKLESKSSVKERVNVTRKYVEPVKKQAEEDEAEKYESSNPKTKVQDSRNVILELKKAMRTMSFKMFLMVLVLMVSVIITFVNEGFSGQMTTNDAFAYMISSLAVVGVSIGINYKAFVSGIVNLFSFKPDSDSSVALAAVAVVIQNIFCIISPDLLVSGYIHIYSLAVGAAFLLSTLGRLVMVRRVHSNYRFILSREQKYTVNSYDDYNMALNLSEGCVHEAPAILYQKKAESLTKFILHSYDVDPVEASGKNLAPLSLLASLLLCIISMFIYRDLSVGVSVFAVSCVLTVAIGNMLAFNSPLSRICKSARRAGSMLSGYSALSSLSKTNCAMFDASDLFPAGSVVLEGIKTFNDKDNEETFRYASALLKAVGGTLGGVMNQITSDDEEKELKVNNFVFEDEHGVSGSVEGRRILVGNRTLLMNHGVTPPERSEVLKHTPDGKKATFIVIDGILKAMLVLSYRADFRKRNEIKKLEQNGVGIVIRSTDSNITSLMMSKVFDISESSVKIICGELGEVYRKLVEDEEESAPAFILTKGRAESMASIISMAHTYKKTFPFISALQTIGVILGFVFVLVATVFGGIPMLSSSAVTFMLLVWFAVLMLVPRFKR